MASNLQALPASWGSRGQVERLTPAAAASLSRVLARAVAETGVNFQINDAYRSKAEQVALFTANYRDRGTRTKRASSDRMYGGTAWRHVTNVAVASPDLYGTGTGANHTRGIAIDIVPSGIQQYLQREGLRSGWSWAEGKRNGEAWHFVYDASKDQYRSEGPLDHAAVQRVVGAVVDGKIGTGTVAKIKAWQAAHGLEADGKVGPATKKAMGLSGKGDAGEPAPIIITPDTAPPAVATPGTAIPSAVPGWMPGADRSQTFSGNPHKAPVTKIVLHTTEGSSWPGYSGGGSAPHMTVKPGAPSIDTIRQHIPSTEAAKALVNKAGGVETNNAGVFQIEYVGSCDKAHAAKHGLFYTGDATDDDLAALAYAVAWAAEAHGVPLYVDPGLSWPTTNAAYETAPQRLTGDGWNTYRGVLGHTHVPENDHWDPGAFPVGLLLELAGGAVVPVVPSPPSGGVLPTGKALLMALLAAPDFPLLRTTDHRCYYGPKTGPKESVSGHQPNSLNPGDVDNGSTGLKTWQAQMNARGYNLTVDGKYGDQSAAAAENLQRLAGITRDSLIGPDAWYAAWLLPVVS